ncbi:MAG: hypothetical protein JWO93_3291 [Micrococcaceae bacterium]|nr:hypothetical protein [Micrococcaceae bacterium]
MIYAGGHGARALIRVSRPFRRPCPAPSSASAVATVPACQGAPPHRRRSSRSLLPSFWLRRLRKKFVFDWHGVEMTIATFHELHHAQSPLLLPNAWDVGSALAFAAAGFPAVGTTSFGIAASAGLPDGGRSSRAFTTDLVAQLSQLSVHITADVEDGYSDDAAEAAAFVSRLAGLGVAGVNMEDSTGGFLVDPAAFAAKVAAVKRRSATIFLNARVDNMWFGEEATVEAVLLRARVYADAGADGIFVPGLVDPKEIAAIADGIRLPVNVLAHPSLTVAELGTLGVRRVSSGSLPYRAAVDAAVAVVNDLRDGGPVRSATPYWEMQRRLEAFEQDKHVDVLPQEYPMGNTVPESRRGVAPVIRKPGDR